MNNKRPPKKIIDILPPNGSDKDEESFLQQEEKPKMDELDFSIPEEEEKFNLEPEEKHKEPEKEPIIKKEENFARQEQKQEWEEPQEDFSVKSSSQNEKIFSDDFFKPKKRINLKKVLIIVGITSIVVAGFIFYFTVSKAEIIIKPKTETVQFIAELGIDKNIAFIDSETSKVPGQLFQVEKEGEKEFLATQEKELREKASGTIKIYNQYSSAPQTLVQNTRLLSEDGKLFRTAQTVVIPGAQVEEGQIIPSVIDVEVIAAEPGDEYNIKPTSFTIPGFKGTAKYNGFYGESIEAMAGGIVGKVKVVSAEDIQGATEILVVELKEQAKKELEKRVPPELKILEDTSLEEIVEASSSVKADQPADKFTVKVKVASKVLGFDENDAISIINENLKNKISEDKVLLPESIDIKYSVIDVNLDKGQARLSCDINEDVAWDINVEKIKQDLLGENEDKVRQYFAARSEVESVRIVFWPFWVKKIPSNDKKVKIVID